MHMLLDNDEGPCHKTIQLKLDNFQLKKFDNYQLKTESNHIAA